MNVSVLLEAGTGGEGFAALGARVTSRAHVMGPDVTLKVRRVCEDLRMVRLLAKL